MTRRTTFLEPAAVASLLLFGCAAEQVDLGNDKPSNSAEASLLAYAGSWTGHAEAYKFGDDSDRVRIAIDDQGQGTVEFGASAPPPAPNDTEHGYPSSEFDPELMSKFFPGFRYPILEASVEDSRLQLRTPPTSCSRRGALCSRRRGSRARFPSIGRASRAEGATRCPTAPVTSARRTRP